MSEQQQESVEEQIRTLKEKILAEVADLREMQEHYKNDPDLQVEERYLEEWFPSRIEAFERWAEKSNKAANDEAYRNSKEFDSTLGAFNSLGRALDVDLESHFAKGETIQIRASRMSRLATEIRGRLSDQNRA